MFIDDTSQKAEILNKQYHSVFTPECENEELPSMVVRRGANSCAYCLRIREEISLGPVALDGSSLLSSFSVPLAVTVISGIDG
jgi:hypothetical protein